MRSRGATLAASNRRRPVRASLPSCSVQREISLAEIFQALGCLSERGNDRTHERTSRRCHTSGATLSDEPIRRGSRLRFRGCIEISWNFRCNSKRADKRGGISPFRLVLYRTVGIHVPKTRCSNRRLVSVRSFNRVCAFYSSFNFSKWHQFVDRFLIESVTSEREYETTDLSHVQRETSATRSTT